MTNFFALLLAFAHANLSPLTLPLDATPTGRGGLFRPLPACQWAARDLVQSHVPGFENTGTGAVLRMKPEVRIKTLGRNRKTRWEKAETLVAYAGKSILDRYADLARKHPVKRNYFYEDEANLHLLLETGRGFTLPPGSLVVADGDASLDRFLFGAPAFAFRVLEAVEIDGETVYRPTGPMGSLPMEVVAKSAEIVFGPSSDTLAGQRAREKAARCGGGLGE